MNTTNSAERVKRNKVLDRFCDPRHLWYEPVNDWDKIDAFLLGANKENEVVGLAKLASSPCNYGTQPAVGVDKKMIGFTYELGQLMSVKVVLIMKFRDRLMYVRLEDIDKLPTRQTKRGKEETLIPIQLFTNL